MTEPGPALETSAAEMVAAAKARIERLSPEQVATALTQDVVLIDLREEDEVRAEGWIAGSLRAPRGMLEFWADPSSRYHRVEFDPRRRLILYSASGGRSALAAATLQEMGYRRIAHLEGGLRAWMEAGKPVELI